MPISCPVVTFLRASELKKIEWQERSLQACVILQRVSRFPRNRDKRGGSVSGVVCHLASRESATAGVGLEGSWGTNCQKYPP